MTDSNRPSAEEIILYEKDPKTKIATMTLNRPEYMNAPTAAARLRYADLIHAANIDDDVKVLVIRGAGDNLGTGADIAEVMEFHDAPTPGPRLSELRLTEDQVTYPPKNTYRYGGILGQYYASTQGGTRCLQDFKKISILEVKGYCYGWHFYQAADADLVVSSDDALFGHPAFRYIGWAPRMWTWAQTMGLRKFQEMVFTGRPFSAKEMYDCNFLNSVVSRDELEAEVQKYALACSRTRPTDAVYMQKVFFEMYKQYQGEYMGSMMTGLFESIGNVAQPDADDLMLDEDVVAGGIPNAVRDNDDQFPPEWRLSRRGRNKTK
ncbi:enoyl-CoA hydratase/isomerase family protein [Streptomyces sp. NPDC090075]|uniref:enoyl-CoA hydratase/isomerase family protein n=1 Tax=Streptomyces sp. NPDC090075 TaxID=3365937 RepID=UPI0038258069